MNIILFDEPGLKKSLLPFTFTRPVAGIRLGIFTLAEKWQHAFPGAAVSFLTDNYLVKKFPSVFGDENICINGAVLPDNELIKAIQAAKFDAPVVKNGLLLFVKTRSKISVDELASLAIHSVEHPAEVAVVKNNWDIFGLNGREIKRDFQWVKENKQGIAIDDPFTRVYSPENIFVEPGAKIKAAVLNAETGPIYIGKDAEIQEGALVRGPFALCEGSVVNMGAKMRGDNTIGPFSKVGGEISNSVIFGYSNKGHDGFLGNSVVGEWCNLGADTNTSNLKNNYSNVKAWNYKEEKLSDTGLQFCGLMMGDHAKAGINTMFNTGTVVGVSANVFGGSFPPKFIPSFAWGGSEGFSKHEFEKALETASRVMQRRKMELTAADVEVLQYVFDHDNYLTIS